MDNPDIVDGWKIGSIYLTESQREVKILEIVDYEGIKSVITRTEDTKETAAYNIKGDPLTNIAKELGKLMSLVSGYEKK